MIIDTCDMASIYHFKNTTATSIDFQSHLIDIVKLDDQEIALRSIFYHAVYKYCSIAEHT